MGLQRLARRRLADELIEGHGPEAPRREERQQALQNLGRDGAAPVALFLYGADGLVLQREAEIEAFKTDEYWTIEALLTTSKGEDVKTRLVAIEGTALKKLDIKDEASATAIKAALEGRDFRVASIEKKAAKRNPYPPFTTSTLQMDASRKLGFSAKQTMQIAQRLYEGVDIGGETVGLITYMRTDSVNLSEQAIAAVAAQRPRPEVVIVFTDGCTPWPAQPIAGTTLVAVLLDSRSGAPPATPEWAIRVECVDEAL